MPTPSGSGISIDEISRRLDEATSRLEQLAGRIETSYVRSDVFLLQQEVEKNAIEQINQRVKALEQRHEWAVRVVGGVLILGFIGALAVYGQLGP